MPSPMPWAPPVTNATRPSNWSMRTRSSSSRSQSRRRRRRPGCSPASTRQRREGGAPRLAGIVAQRLVDEFERAKDLVANEPVGEVGAQLVFGELGGRLDQSMDSLAEIGVWDADHHRGQHLRVGVEGGLDLRWIDVGALEG